MPEYKNGTRVIWRDEYLATVEGFIPDLDSYIIKCDGGHFEYCLEHELEELPE